MPLIIRNDQDKIEILKEWQDKLNEIVEVFFSCEEIDDEAEISLLFVDNENIKELNKTYRDKDNKTDVLSFPLWDPEEELEEDEEFLLGDIVISLETALEQAEEYAHSLSREICYLFVHGLLHLIGYDHLTDEDKNIMRQQEEKILNSVEMPR